MKNSENLKFSVNLDNSENLEAFEKLTISERVLRFAMQRPKFENSKSRTKS